MVKNISVLSKQKINVEKVNNPAEKVVTDVEMDQEDRLPAKELDLVLPNHPDSKIKEEILSKKKDPVEDQVEEEEKTLDKPKKNAEMELEE